MTLCQMPRGGRKGKSVARKKCFSLIKFALSKGGSGGVNRKLARAKQQCRLEAEPDTAGEVQRRRRVKCRSMCVAVPVEG